MDPGQWWGRSERYEEEQERLKRQFSEMEEEYRLLSRLLQFTDGRLQVPEATAEEDRGSDVGRVECRPGYSTGVRVVTWAEFKEAIEGKGVTGRDVITGFRWFNDQHSKYYVTVWFEGERDEQKRKGITIVAEP
jgi:formylglycine-generating enzyme required for sulfatase activity